jgi:hypothetical protein
MMQQMLLVTTAEELFIARIVQKVASWASVELRGMIAVFVWLGADVLEQKV